MAWFGLAKIALQAGSKIYANRQKTKMAMSDAQLIYGFSSWRAFLALREHKSSVMEGRNNGYK